MNVSFVNIKKNHAYSRKELAKIWGYKSIFPLSRGVVTPRDNNLIILFVTIKKHGLATPFRDRLVNNVLEWEGPNDHFAEDRIISSRNTHDKIHLFLRQVYTTPEFLYYGPLRLLEFERRASSPSKFKFEII